MASLRRHDVLVQIRTLEVLASAAFIVGIFCMSEHARLKWLCRRGMKELDVLLEHYLEHEYPVAVEDERAAFRALLDLQDPVLLDYLMDRDQPQGEATRHVVRKLASALRR